MWRISNTVLIFLVLSLSSCSYLEFGLIRTIPDKEHYQHQPVVCKNETTLNQDAQYHQICFQKDISYSIQFINDAHRFMMSVDLTTPISWIKGPQCIVQGSNKKCTRIEQTLREHVSDTKKKIANKFHKKKAKDMVEDAIIEGSSEIIRGQNQKSKNISFIARDSSRLNNFFQLIMLGLFIYGQTDLLQLVQTNFINATTISPNLNVLSDGAISLRFDQTSQNSFLNQIFTYVKATQKTVTLYVGGQNQTITIGDMTAKYTQNGYSSIEWIDMPEDQGFGKLPRLSDIGFQDREEDTEGETPQELTAVLTLSASYIGLPQAVITTVFNKYLAKEFNCTVNSKSYFIECSASNKKKFDKLKQKNIFFSFSGKNIMLPLSKLVLQQQSKKIILNIKKTFNNRVILGEPVFLQHFIVLDYTKNRFGFAPKRINFNEFFISVITLVRFLCFIFVIGCSFILCFQPCRMMFKAFVSRTWIKRGQGNQSRRLKQYSPIQENPYQDLKGKIQDVIGSTEKQVEGI